MTLLLDTHIFLFYVTGDLRLTQTHRELIENPANAIFLSSISATEIAIKHGLGKLPLPGEPVSYVPAIRGRHHISELPLTERAALLVSTLPPIHRDPFDRLLISQSLTHDFPLITSDPLIHQYRLSIDELQLF